MSCRFRNKRRYRSNIANFSNDRVFYAPLTGFPLELDIGAGDQKTTVLALPGGDRSLTIFTAVWIEYTNYVTDGRTDTGRQHRTALTRGKTVKRMSYSDWGIFLRSLHAVINMIFP